MISGRKITVTVPAYNEEKLIARTLASIPKDVDNIIVVDDCSVDSTAQVLSAIDDPRVHVLRHESNRGVGAAIVSGYQAFLAGEDEICVVMAGDAQMDPRDLYPLIEPVAAGRADYAKGNRLMAKDVRRVMPRDRFLGNTIFTILTKCASGYFHVVDSQCGYTAITRHTLENIDIERVYSRYGFPNDFLIHLNVARARVCDVPVSAVYGDEVSGINPWITIPRISLLLFKGFWRRMWQRYVLREFHPLALLYVFGLVVAGMGLAFGVWILWHRWVHDSVPTPATVILAALFMIVGFQSVLFAMMFDMLHNDELSVRP